MSSESALSATQEDITETSVKPKINWGRSEHFARLKLFAGSRVRIVHTSEIYN